MTIPPILWLIIVPLGAIPVVYLMRRSGLGVLVAAGAALSSAWLTLSLPLGPVISLLGRSIAFDQLSQITLILLFVSTALLFLIAYPLTSVRLSRNANKADTGRGRTFHTVGLATLTIFVAANLARHLGIAVVLIEVAALLTVIIIQGRRLGSIRAAQRFLILMTLAVPLFLFAAWRIDQYQLSGGTQSIIYLRQTTLLIGFGFALWLAVWPFHGWQSTTAAEASPPSAAFVLIVFPVVAFSTLIHLLIDSPWLVTAAPLPQVMMIAGGGTVLLAGMLAAVQRGFSPLMGYAALYALGSTLAMLGFGGEAALITVLASLAVRALALVLIAACLVAIRLNAAHDGFGQITGLAPRLPVATMGLVIGGFTLAGAPATAGFPVQWQLVKSIAQVEPRWSILLVLAGLGVAGGYLRGLHALLPTSTQTNPKEQPSTDAALKIEEPLFLVVIIGLLALACMGWGFFPSLLIEPLQQLLIGLPVPIR